MQILGSHTLVATSLLTLLTGCANLQEEVPIPQEEEAPPAKIDYIDDRVATPDEEIVLPVEEPDEVVEISSFDAPDQLEGEASAEAVRPIRQISLLAGGREFTDDEIWDRVDAELSLGIEYAHEVSNGLGFEVGALGSIGTENTTTGNPDVTGAAAELYGGARYFLRRDRWTPYVGAGLSAIFAGVDDDEGGQVADDQDFSLGLYLHGGVQYNLNDTIFIGADLRTLLATELELETIDGDADYVQLAFVLGFRL